jgi:hypothetical protein
LFARYMETSFFRGARKSHNSRACQTPNYSCQDAAEIKSEITKLEILNKLQPQNRNSKSETYQFRIF